MAEAVVLRAPVDGLRPNLESETEVIGNARPQPHRSHCRRGHEMTAENTIISSADGHRRCRTCNQASRARQRRVRVEPIVMVVCPECDRQREITGRNARKISLGQSSGRCAECRYGWNKLVPLRQAEDYVQWWRDRGFTPDDAHVIWSAISNGLPSTLTDVLMGSMRARITEQDMTREAA